LAVGLLGAAGLTACGFPTISFEPSEADGGTGITSSASASLERPRLPGAITASSSAVRESASTSKSSGASAATGTMNGATSSATMAITMTMPSNGPSVETTTTTASSTTTVDVTTTVAWTETSTSTSDSTTSSSTSTATTSSTTTSTSKEHGGGDGHGDGNGGGQSATAPCPDADGDGYTAASCGGTDCNDEDARAHPGVTAWVDAVPASAPGWKLGDWNCDGSVEYEFPGNVDCPSATAHVLAGGACGDIQGFTGARPGCGAASGTFVHCQSAHALPIACTAGVVSTKTEACL
jgi:hypothetical protein